ncbi:MAG: S8 family serine peptidase [Candidatus Limnocylindrales bacterium]
MHRKALFAAVATALLLAATLPLGTLAVGPRLSADRLHRLDVHGIDPQLLPALLTPNRQVTVMLQLVADPVSVRQAKSTRRLSTIERSSIRAAVKRSQDRIAPEIRADGGRIVAQLQDAYDGIQVRAPASAVARFARLPGVTAVRSVQVFHRSNTVAVPYIGAPQAWSATKATGKGVVIADIDTGIDFYHADFGGTGSVADFTYGEAHDTTIPARDADGTTVAFPSTKVPKGYDFVGDDYDADPNSTTYQPIPHPDGNPLDCGIGAGGDGHGSHTAGTAAGEGVLSNGSTFGGPYDGNTYTAHSFLVGPGVAPQATIYAYRVFGCVGSTEVIAAAIDRAVKDGANVINLSLGTDFGRADDPTTVAADNAAAAGTVVVSSSGNAGPSGYVTGSPAAGDRVLSVAALDAEFASYPGAGLDLGVDGLVEGINANDGGPLPASGPLRVLMSGGDIALGCDDGDYAAVVPGDIVVTRRGDCDRVARASFGQAHGAAAVVMVNDSPELPPFEGTIPGVTIPFIGVDLADAGALIDADGTTITVSTSDPIANDTYRHVADFSSAGPRNGDSAPKPDVTAPGVAMTSAGVGSGTAGEVLSGTSMASPMGAGTAALVKAAHPTWTVDRIKAAIMNTATVASSSIAGYEVRSAGAGVISAGRAVSTVGLATTADHLDSLAFGFRALGGAYSEKKAFTLTNTGPSAITYDLAASFVGARLGTAVSLSPKSVTVANGGHVTVTATLSIGAAAVVALDDADIFSGAGPDPGGIIVVQGAVTATPRTSRPGVYQLRVPFVFVPRGLSAVTAAPRAPFVPTGGSGLLANPIHPAPPTRGRVTSSSVLRNGGIHASIADVYTWGLSDAADAPGSVDLRSVGVQSLPGAGFFGVDASDRVLVFAVNTWRSWSTPVADEFDIGIDTNGDGLDDFIVVSADLGALTTGQPNGQLYSFTFDVAGNLIDGWAADAPMNGSVVELPTLASDLGLSAGTSTFDYDIVGFSNETGAVDTVAGAAHVDAYDQLVSDGDYIPLDPAETETLPLAADLTRLSLASPHASQPLGWMVVALDDAAGAAQADLIPVGRGH